MEAKQYATTQPMDHQRNQRGNPKILGDKWKQKHNDSKSMGHSKNSTKREVYSDTSLPQETRKISNKQPNLIHQGAKKKNKQNLKLVEGKKS